MGRGPGLLLAVARPAFPFIVGGDGTIAHTLLAGLTARGIPCAFVGCRDETLGPRLERLAAHGLASRDDGVSVAYDLSYPVILARADAFEAVLERELHARRPGWVLAQLNGAPTALALAKRHRMRTALYLLDVDHEEAFAALAADPDLVFAVSDFVRAETARRFDRVPRVLYPLIDFASYRTERVGDAIAMINPVPVKGGETALAVAAALPDQRFLFVEGWRTIPSVRARVRRLPNAVWVAKHVDMRPVYRRTGVLLVPSLWREGFGRVVLEAQINGIPVIASRIGGLPEAVGAGGVLLDDFRRPEVWIAAVARLLADRAEHDRLAARARQNCTRFRLDRELDRVVRLLDL